VPRKRGVLRPTLQGFRCAPASVHYRCGTPHGGPDAHAPRRDAGLL